MQADVDATTLSIPRAERLFAVACMLALLFLPADAHAHAVDAGDKGYIQCTFGLRLVPFS